MGLIGKRIAPSRNRNQIRKDTYQLRKMLNLDQTEFFPIMHVLENILPLIYPDFHIEAVEDNELPGRMAETTPEQWVIRVKQSVYTAACNGDAWARMIMAHELGHFILHSSQNTAFAYRKREPSTARCRSRAAGRHICC